MTVDTVVKQAVQKADHLPKFRSNAGKVTSKGLGLKRAVLNKQNTFTVNCLDAGETYISIGIVTFGCAAWNASPAGVFSVLFHPCIEGRTELATNDVTTAGLSCCRMSRY